MGHFRLTKMENFFKKSSHIGSEMTYLYMKERKIYHLYPRGVRRGNLFESGDQHAMFQVLAAKYAYDLGIDILVLVLMTNHYHTIIECEECAKSEFMKRLNWAYARSYNSIAGLSGHAFESSCKGKEIRGNGLLAHTARYGFLNAVVAGMVASPIDHLASSYGSTIGERPPMPGIRPERLLRCFAADVDESRKLLKAYVECLTPSHPVVREALKHWDESTPASSKSRNCRRVVEFAALTSAAIAAGSDGFKVDGTLLLNQTELQLVGMQRLTGATGPMMAAISDLPKTTVNRMLARIKNILAWDSSYQERLDQHLESILLPKSGAIRV
jgi:REP element-mobilizing transposase RayT